MLKNHARYSLNLQVACTRPDTEGECTGGSSPR
jgi:hypothetical protein